MFGKRLKIITIVAISLILLCTACTDEVVPQQQDYKPIEHLDGTITWNGLQLIREGIGNVNRWNSGDIFVSQNDILFTIESPYPAQSYLTTADTMLTMVVENLSGKDYYTNEPTLEKWQNSGWKEVSYLHANVGFMSGWEISRNVLFLDKPLPAGRYRLRLPMHADGTVFIEPQSEFTVWTEKEALQPDWDSAQLTLSRYDAAEQGTEITMSIKDPALNNHNTELKVKLDASQLYNYGELYEMDVLLDGQWYSVPYADGIAFTLLKYTVNPNKGYSRDTFSCNPTHSFGILPEGQYRLVWEFTQPGTDSDHYTVLAREFALAEFTVSND